MTLVELLTAELIGGLVITAAIMLVVISFTGSQRVSDRVNSLQQGRILAAQLEQRLNSQVCLYAGEYALDGVTNYTTSADSILFASANKIIFFADVGKNGGTSATGSAGFVPNIRYLYFDSGPTTGPNAGRKGSFVDGQRSPLNSTVPFNFDVPTGVTGFESFASPSGQAGLPATATRIVVDGVTNDVTGSTDNALPFFEYWDTAEDPLPITAANGALAQTSLENIGHIRVNFRILAESGRDSGAQNTSKQDTRTASFNSDIVLRTNPSICG
ncbi:MAG: hypothetical protein JHC98_02530 [Thermoleophilaceae bacterium]|nr:hypothetical protein [Thermoleophilaceae bacterium]